MGQPLEYALSVCVLAVRLGEALGLDESKLRQVYYLALLRHIGCNAETYTMSALFGDELATRPDSATAALGRASQAIGLLVRSIRKSHEDASPLQLARLIAQGMITSPQVMKEAF